MSLTPIPPPGLGDRCGRRPPERRLRYGGGHTRRPAIPLPHPPAPLPGVRQAVLPRSSRPPCYPRGPLPYSRQEAPMAKVSLQLDPALWQRVRAASKAHHLSASELVVVALLRQLPRWEQPAPAAPVATSAPAA